MSWKRALALAAKAPLASSVVAAVSTAILLLSHDFSPVRFPWLAAIIEALTVGCQPESAPPAIAP